MDSDSASYDTVNHVWNGKYRTIQNDQYTGNLLFYAKEDIGFDALDPTDSIQGTFISRKTIHMKQNVKLAGQLIANYVKIDAFFDGSGFIFVPFNPPKIDPGALARGTYKENDKLVPIDIKLDKIPTTDVRFNYCFKTPGDSAGYNFAEPEDIKDGVPSDMPRCGATTGPKTDSVLIHAGEVSPTDSVYKAWVRVARDSTVEGDEWFYICISNLSGAIIKGNYPTDINDGICLPLLIQDADNHSPVLENNDDLKVTENVLGDTAGTISALDEDGDPLTLRIVGGSGKNLFEIDSDGNLYLKPNTSVDYEKNTSFTVQVSVTDGKIPSPVKKTYTVKVVDVNERPVAKDMVFSIKENTAGGKIVDYLDWDDLDTKADFVKHDISIAIEDDDSDTDIFEIAKDGTIKVKNGAVIDYEVKKVHTLKVRIVDSLETSLSDTAYVTINVIDEDDGPKIDIPSDPGNNPKKHILVLKNGKQPGVKENNAKDELAGKVTATCSAIDCMKHLTFSMPEDTS